MKALFPDNSIPALRLARLVRDHILISPPAPQGGRGEAEGRLQQEYQALVALRGSQWAEDELQALLVAALRTDLLAPYVITWHHSPLGFDRSAVQAQQAKRTGATAGWPDLQLILRNIQGEPVQLFVELKTDSGSLSPVQRETHARLTGAGFQVCVCHGILSCVDALIDALRGDEIKTRYKRRTA